jgi:hypothetical protein
MRWLHSCLFLIALIAKRDQAYARNDSLAMEVRFAASDEAGNLFVVTENNLIQKIDSNLNIAATLNLMPYGFASSLECRGSQEVLVYCYGSGLLIVFDNFLKEKNRFDLNTVLKRKPDLVCISGTGWWCYNESELSITRYAGNFQLQFILPGMIKTTVPAIKMAELNEKQLGILFSNDQLDLIPYSPSDKKKEVMHYRFKGIPYLNYAACLDYQNKADSLHITNLIENRKYSAYTGFAEKDAILFVKSGELLFMIGKKALFLRHVPFLLAP